MISETKIKLTEALQPKLTKWKEKHEEQQAYNRRRNELGMLSIKFYTDSVESGELNVGYLQAAQGLFKEAMQLGNSDASINFAIMLGYYGTTSASLLTAVEFLGKALLKAKNMSGEKGNFAGIVLQQGGLDENKAILEPILKKMIDTHTLSSMKETLVLCRGRVNDYKDDQKDVPEILLHFRGMLSEEIENKTSILAVQKDSSGTSSNHKINGF